MHEIRGKTKRGRSWLFELILGVLGFAVLLFIVAPLASMALSTPAEALWQAAGDREVLDSLKVTLLAALFATAAAAVGGIPLAYLLARKRFPGRSLVMAIVDLPIIIPHSAAGIALLTVIGRQSTLGRVFGGGLTGSVAGISIAMAFVSVPFLIAAAREAFEAVPTRLEHVARTLGASPSRVFFTVSLPLAWRGILSGLILMWGRGISEFGAVVIIAYHPMTTPVMVFRWFENYGLTAAKAVAVLLIVICTGLFVVFRLLSGFRAEESLRA